jgi:REP element-mobilizing transposase RayT
MTQPHHRRSIRLPGYDYAAAGAYFITICTYGRACLFGQIVDGETRLNALGEIVREEWEKSASIRAEIEIREYVIMPNHIHAIVMIHWGAGLANGMGDRPVARTEEKPVARTENRPVARTEERPNGPDSKSVGALIGGFKSAATTRINQIRNTPGAPVWQRNYYEHIIRDEPSYENIAAYILNNPQQWEADQLFRTP